jgi:glycine C-acetyltransferase
MASSQLLQRLLNQLHALSEVNETLTVRLLELGVYVVGFFFPVVPRGKARIRVQISAVHSRADLEFAAAAFAQAGRELGILREGAAA